MRAFIALELPNGIKDRLSGIQEKLKIEFFTPLSGEILTRSAKTLNFRTKIYTRQGNISWIKPQNLHLTLKFLGDILPAQLNEIKRTIRKISEASFGFKIKLIDAGVFPNLTTGGIIWIGNQEAPGELKQIVERLETGLSLLGIKKEKRDFRAHITIGRFKIVNPVNSLQVICEKLRIVLSDQDLEFDCGKITLFSSTLAASGPAYKILDEFNLKIT